MRGLVRNRKIGLERANFCRHQALGAIAEAYQKAIAGLQIHNAETAQRFHMDEDVFRAFAARDKAKAARLVCAAVSHHNSVNNSAVL